MLFELIITGAVGLLCVSLGLMLWKKQKISLIHSYHYTKVKQNDIKAYTTLMGKGVVMIGVGCILTGIIDYFTHTAYGWFGFSLFFIIGFIFIGKAQRKFNGGFF